MHIWLVPQDRNLRLDSTACVLGPAVYNKVFNRPSVAGAVLQTALSLNNYQTRVKPGAALQTPPS